MTPFAHQLSTIEFLRTRNHVYIASTAGTGKSLCIVKDVEHRYFNNPKSKTLILAPKSLLDTVWSNEFNKWAPALITSTAIAPDKKRIAAFNKEANVYITNIDALKWLASQPAKFWKDYETIIIDESTAISNDSLRTKAALKISNFFKYRRCLSGTPTNGLLTKLFYQYKFLDGGQRLGISFTNFRNNVLIAKQTGPSPNMITWSNKPGRDKVLAHMLKDITIRHVLEEVQDMPAVLSYTYTYTPNIKIQKAYSDMKNTLSLQLVSGEQINAVNAAAMSTKLAQIACLTGDTEILTNEGWKEIQHLNNNEKLWDGNQWINYDKLLDKGIRNTINCWGVRMTLDHKLLTDKGWKEAKEIVDVKSSNRFIRSNFRLPNGYSEGRFNTNRTKNISKSNMAMPMYMWKRNNNAESKLTSKKQNSQILWMPMGKMEQNSWAHKISSFIQSLDKNKKSLHLSIRQRLSQLWWSWYKVMQRMGKLQPVYTGYGTDIQERINPRQNRQQQKLLKNKLQMEHSQRASKQYTDKQNNRYSSWQNECNTSREKIWTGQKCNKLSTKNEMGRERERYIPTTNEIKSERVYDILNAGTKHQFLIRNKQGFEFISHNSGSVKVNAETDDIVLIDFQRYDLVLDLCAQYEHTIVFFNWKHQRVYFMQAAEKAGLNATFIDGTVPLHERTQRVDDFQNGIYDVIFLQPQSSAHGITLTTAHATIWSVPTYLSDYYTQGNARMIRTGQKKRTTIIHIEAIGTIDHVIYDKLQGKLNSMEALEEALK